MALTRAEKDQVRAEYASAENDTGSTTLQIAMLTTRINVLVEHLRAHKHDFASERGLLKMVGQRKRLLAYLRKTSPDSYTALIQRLGLRR
jgi:small subunit ribosomal protein S15